MSTGNPKVLLHLELKNKLKGAFGQAKQFVNSNIKEMQDKINTLKTSHMEAFSEMKDSIPGLSSALGMLKNPYGMAIAATLALGAAFTKASAMANQFDTSMSKVNVTAKMGSGELAEAKGRVLDIAGRSSLAGAAQSAPEALGVMISGGMDKNTALQSLEPTLQAAKVGFTDVATTARAATAVMNSSGIKDANRIYDVLAMTLNKGNAEFSDIANYLPKIVPAAKDAGFNLEQVAGSFAYLTAQGQTSEKAATMLENAFKALSDPERVADFKKIGVAVYDSMGKMRPMADIVDSLKGKMDGLTDQSKGKLLDSLGMDMEARGAFSAMAQDAGLLRGIINDTTNSTGELKRQLEAVKTPMDSWLQMGNKIDTIFISVGEKVNESLGAIGEKLAPVADVLLPKIGDFFMLIWERLQAFLTPIGKAVAAMTEWGMKSELLKDSVSAIGKLFEAQFYIVQKLGEAIGWLYEHTIKPQLEAIETVYRTAKNLLGLGAETPDPKKAEIDRQRGIYEAAMTADSMRPEWEAAMLRDDIRQTQDRQRDALGGNKNLVTGEGGKKSAKSEETGIISGAKNVRQITVTIDSFIKGDFVSQNQNFSQMNPKQLEAWFSDMLNRAVRNMEAGYS